MGAAGPRSSMHDRLVGAGLARFADELLAAGTPSIRLRRSAGALRGGGGSSAPTGDVEVLDEDLHLPLGCTKVGGRPDVGPGFVWPRWEVEGLPAAHAARSGRRTAGALGFVAQVNLSEVHSYHEDSVLPDRGLLAFFYDEDAFLQTVLGARVMSSAVVVFTDPAQPLHREALPDDVDRLSRFSAARLTPEPDFTLFPWPEVRPGGAVADWSRRELDAWDRVLPGYADGPLDRMLGYPDLIQDTPVPGEEVLLLQIDADPTGQHSVDAGRIYFLIEPVHLRERRFDEAYFVYQCD